MVSWFTAVTNKEISSIIKQAVPEIREEGDKIWFGSFSFVCLTWILLMKLVKKFLVYKCKLSLALLYLADMFIKKLKSKFNSFFTEWFQVQKEFITPFEEISKQ